MPPVFHEALADWPSPNTAPIKLRVSGSAESHLRRGHPWLYAERIQDQSAPASAGDLAVVFDKKRAFLAIGLYDPHSPIRMRVLRARKSGPIDANFFAERIDTALARRAPILATDTNGYRLVHGESDGLPGLVIDRYADVAVVKLYTHAWLPHLTAVLTALLERQPFARIVLRFARLLSDKPEHLGGLADGDTIYGNASDDVLVYRENGLLFEVDPVHGQKTGCFLDQRDNRARVGEIAQGKRVLNVCSYTGGFSLSAARGGATEVCSVDLSAPALAAAERNFALNMHDSHVAAARHDTVQGDAFVALPELAATGRRFDIVILDPPSFARRRAQVDRALQAYARLTRMGLALLERDGTLISASCSSPVTPEAFATTISAAAQQVGRPLREIESFDHAVDHPLDFAESRYLKCLFARA